MTTNDVRSTHSRDLRRRGAVVLAVFALLWGAVAASGLPAGAAWTVRVVAVLTSAVLVATALRSGGSRPERSRRQPEGWHRWVGIVNLGQFVVIALVVVASLAAGVPQLVPPVVCLVVGLHFFPLARLFDQPQYTWTAVGLCAAAAAGLAVLVVGPGQEVSRVVIGSVAALTLWGTSAWLSLRG